MRKNSERSVSFVCYLLLAVNRIVLYILLFFAGMVAAQENARTEALEKTILFYGMVQDSSFAPGEKLNVEILEI